MTASGNTCADITKVRVIYRVPSVFYPTCKVIYEGAVVPSVQNGSIVITNAATIQNDYTNLSTGCSGYLGDVPVEVMFVNSYGAGPLYKFNDYWD